MSVPASIGESIYDRCYTSRIRIIVRCGIPFILYKKQERFSQQKIMDLDKCYIEIFQLVKQADSRLYRKIKGTSSYYSRIYIIFAATTFKYDYDYYPGDVYFCIADIGWIAGHTYIWFTVR